MVYYTVLSYNNSKSSDPVSFRNRKKKKNPQKRKQKGANFLLKIVNMNKLFFSLPLYPVLEVKHFC